MDKKTTAAIEALDAGHAKATAARRTAIDAAHRDIADAQAMLRDAIEKVRRLQQEHTNASFAYDAERAELVARGTAQQELQPA
jgi:hypothetical protein